MSRRAVVTGASGFIGHHLLRELAGTHEVTAIGRGGAPGGDGADAARWVIGDVTDDGSVAAVMHEADVLFHLAAHVPGDLDDPREAARCLAVNAIGTLNVVRAARDHGVGRIVVVSTASVYGDGGGPFAESSPAVPSGAATVYAGSKLVGELYASHAAGDVPVVVLRPTAVFGAGMPSRSLVARFLRLGADGSDLSVESAATTSDFVHVDDVVSCLVAAAESEVTGTFNVGSGTVTSVLELAEAVVDVCGRGRVIVGSGAARRFPVVNIDRAAEAWGYRPRTLHEGLRSMLRWST